jgi:hypothetical protein
MHVKVVRTTFTDRSTIGEMHVDDAFACFTLEDAVRPVKVPGMTAIPEGVYVMTVSFSSRFQRLLPEIHNVREFTGVRVHAGNTDADTEGCILVGQTRAADFVGNSRAAFNKLFPRIQAAAQREKIFIEVTSAAPAVAGLLPLARAARGMVGVSPPPAHLDGVLPPPARLALVRPAAPRRKAARGVEPSKPRVTRKRPAAPKRAVTTRSAAGSKKNPATGPKRAKAATGIRRR